MVKKGVIISSDLNNIDKFKNCIFLRAGFTDYDNNKTKFKDKNFEENYKYAKENNIKIGVYYESRATNINEASDELSFYFDIIKDKIFEYPICIKIEDDHSTIIYYPQNQSMLNKEKLCDIVIYMYNTIREHNYISLIITYKNWYNQKLYKCNINFLLEDDSYHNQ